MLPSSRMRHLLNKPPRYTMVLRGQVNTLGTLSSSPSGGWGRGQETPSSATSLSTRMMKTGSSWLTKTGSSVLPPFQGQTPHLMVHEEVQTGHLFPGMEKGGFPSPQAPCPGRGVSTSPSSMARADICKCKRAFPVKAALGLLRLKHSSKACLNM